MKLTYSRSRFLWTKGAEVTRLHFSLLYNYLGREFGIPRERGSSGLKGVMQVVPVCRENENSTQRIQIPPHFQVLQYI
jgi:hypothetical protein